jgi:hypothetical protein
VVSGKSREEPVQGSFCSIYNFVIYFVIYVINDESHECNLYDDQ